MKRLIPFLLLGLIALSCDESTNPDQGPDLSRIQAILEDVSLDSLTRTVRDLSGEQMATIGGRQVLLFTRKTGTDANYLAAQYLHERLSGYGLTTIYHRQDPSRPNVIATKTGTLYPDRRIIICAHFDNTSQTDTIPGADDNASGTAVVLEAARLLSGYTSDATIIFALFNEEEQGLWGSAEYAQLFKTSSYADTYVINLDMVAWDSDNDHVLEIHTRDIASSNALADTLVFVNRSLGLGLNTVIMNPGSNRSDHASFWTHNRSAVMMIEEIAGGDFNQYYHSRYDLLTYFNMEFFIRNAWLGIATVALLAGSGSVPS